MFFSRVIIHNNKYHSSNWKIQFLFSALTKILEKLREKTDRNQII